MRQTNIKHKQSTSGIVIQLYNRKDIDDSYYWIAVDETTDTAGSYTATTV